MPKSIIYNPIAIERKDCYQCGEFNCLNFVEQYKGGKKSDRDWRLLSDTYSFILIFVCHSDLWLKIFLCNTVFEINIIADNVVI